MNAAGRILVRWVRAVTLRVRLRRALVAASIATTAMCVAGVLPPAAHRLGLEIPWWLNGAELVFAASIVVLPVILVALLAPVQTVRVVSDADRRSHLDGALVAAFEAIGTDEPIARLLVRRTAQQVERLATERAVSLTRSGSAATVASMALLVLAVVLPAAGASAGGEPLAAGDGAMVLLSARLREAAAAIVSDVDIPAAERSALVRRMLDVDAGLLGGTVSLEDARRTLGELPGPPGESYSRLATSRPEGAGRVGAGQRSGMTEDAGTTHANTGNDLPFPDTRGDAGSPGGGAPGAGTGDAELRALPATAGDPGRTPATAEWTLPRVAGSEAPARGGMRRPGGDEDASVDVDLASARLRSVERLLTREERALVESYLERLQRLSRHDPATTRR